MKIVAALTDPALALTAEKLGADLIELRLDLIQGDIASQVEQCRKTTKLSIIGTLRSAKEGGQFFGSADEWFQRIEPLLPFFDYVDVEQRYCSHAAAIKKCNKTVIASFHTPAMPPLFGLFGLERDLRNYGDIVKIIATPKSDEDVIEMIAFTHGVKLPVCTGVMGGDFRYARVVLALFGSEFVYCHVGTPTAAGQYSVEEFVSVMKLLGRR